MPHALRAAALCAFIFARPSLRDHEEIGIGYHLHLGREGNGLVLRWIRSQGDLLRTEASKHEIT